MRQDPWTMKTTKAHESVGGIPSELGELDQLVFLGDVKHLHCTVRTCGRQPLAVEVELGVVLRQRAVRCGGERANNDPNNQHFKGKRGEREQENRRNGKGIEGSATHHHLGMTGFEGDTGSRLWACEWEGREGTGKSSAQRIRTETQLEAYGRIRPNLTRNISAEVGKEDRPSLCVLCC